MTIRKKDNKVVIAIICAYFAAINTYANNLPPFFKKVQTNIQDPMKLRDPFKSNLAKVRPKAQEKASKMLKDGSYSNVPKFENIPLDNIVIVGTLLGPTRIAMAKIAPGPGIMPEMNAPSFIIKEGMILGENNAEVRAIVHGGIVLVEKVEKCV